MKENITYGQLRDKVKVFETAGVDTKAFDYAIPQQWADDLRAMGLDNPSLFVADCSGTLPVLRTIGEAILTILNQRSEHNKDVLCGLMEAAESPECSVGDRDIWNIVRNSAGNVVFNEADAGLLDLNMLAALLAEAYGRGRIAGRSDEKRFGFLMESELIPRSEGTKAHRIVLRNIDGQYVTHLYTPDDGGYHNGGYFDNQIDALTDYLRRCQTIAAKPFSR